MKVLILTADSNGAYPVPASKGGAVSTLIEYLVAGNNLSCICDMEILSFYEKRAEEISKTYQNVKFRWIKVPLFVKFLDWCSFTFIRLVKRNEKAISYKSPFSLLYYVLRARKMVKKEKFDKIILENNIPLALTLKGVNTSAKLYYHFHNVPRVDAYCRDVMSRIDKFVCVSHFVANQICSSNSAIGIVPKDKVTILYNSVDTDVFRPIDKYDENLCQIRKDYSLDLNDKVLLFTGRLTEEKGVDVVLQALKHLPMNIKALIVGSFHYNFDVKSEYQEKLNEFAKELGERIIFTGYVQHSQLPYLYNLADIAVLPSLWEEPAGLTNLEAMACGVPVITTDSGGIPEYVGDSIILKRNKQLSRNVAEVVIDLMGNHDKYQSISKRSRDWVVNNFNKDKYIEKFIKCLQ